MTDRATRGQVFVVQGAAPVVGPDFRAVFEENFDYVWNSLRHFGVHAADLEDLTHEVFLRVHERFDECDHTRPLRPWLFAFACRVALAHRRRVRHRHEVGPGSDDPVADTTPADEALSDREDRELALKALACIELDRLPIFLLHELDGVAIPDVARELRISVNTAYSRLRLAREEFQSAARRLRVARGDR